MERLIFVQDFGFVDKISDFLDGGCVVEEFEIKYS
jgi:hypothetical protein